MAMLRFLSGWMAVGIIVVLVVVAQIMASSKGTKNMLWAAAIAVALVAGYNHLTEK